MRDIADVVHIDDVSGIKTKKHLHDVRGTFCTKLIIDGKLTDSEAAEVMGWAPDRVSMIRRIYVDQSRVVQAMGAKLHAIK